MPGYMIVTLIAIVLIIGLILGLFTPLSTLGDGNKFIPLVESLGADKEIILITSENISEYISFPDYILEKWKNYILMLT